MIIDRLTRRSQQIGNFPLSGRIVPEAELPQIREIFEGSYRIIYHIKPDQVDIIAVIHGSQQTPWT
jgi:toxin ParE1/3/4